MRGEESANKTFHTWVTGASGDYLLNMCVLDRISEICPELSKLIVPDVIADRKKIDIRM